MGQLPQFYMGSPMIIEAALRRGDQELRGIGGLAQLAGWLVRRVAERRERQNTLDAELEKHRAMLGADQAQAEADRGSERPATAPVSAPEPGYEVNQSPGEKRVTLSKLGETLWRGVRRGMQEAGSIVGVANAPGEKEKLLELSRLMGRVAEREAQRKGAMVGLQMGAQYADPAAAIRVAQTGEVPPEGLKTHPMVHAPTNEWSATAYASQFPPGDPRRAGIDDLMRRQYELERAKIDAMRSRQGSDMDWFTKQLMLMKLAGMFGGSGDDRFRNAMIGRFVAAGLNLDSDKIDPEILMRLATQIPPSAYIKLMQRFEGKEPLLDFDAVTRGQSPFGGNKNKLPFTYRDGRWVDVVTGEDLGAAPSWIEDLMRQYSVPPGGGRMPIERQLPGEGLPVPGPKQQPGTPGPQEQPSPVPFSEEKPRLEPSAPEHAFVAGPPEEGPPEPESFEGLNLPPGISVNEKGELVNEQGIRFGRVTKGEKRRGEKKPPAKPPINLPSGLFVDDKNRIVNKDGVVFGHIIP